MKQKTIKSEVFEINTSLLNKAQKTIYTKVSNNYRFWETYELLKFIYKNEINFSDIFMRDFFNILIKTNEYTSILNKYIEDESINEYVNAINSKNDSFEFIWNLIETELKNEAEIFERNPKLLRLFNNNE